MYVRTESGMLRILDFIVTNDDGLSFAAIEAKANTATRSSRQLYLDRILEVQGGRIVSTRPLFHGLERGNWIKMHTTEISVQVKKP